MEDPLAVEVDDKVPGDGPVVLEEGHHLKLHLFAELFLERLLQLGLFGLAAGLAVVTALVAGDGGGRAGLGGLLLGGGDGGVVSVDAGLLLGEPFVGLLF